MTQINKRCRVWKDFYPKLWMMARRKHSTPLRRPASAGWDNDSWSSLYRDWIKLPHGKYGEQIEKQAMFSHLLELTIRSVCVVQTWVQLICFFSQHNGSHCVRPHLSLLHNKWCVSSFSCEGPSVVHDGPGSGFHAQRTAMKAQMQKNDHINITQHEAFNWFVIWHSWKNEVYYLEFWLFTQAFIYRNR